MKRLSIDEPKAFVAGLLKGTEDFDNLDELADLQQQPRRPLRSDKEVSRVMAILDSIEAGKGQAQQ